jgi:adenine-specific DNA-methyltransferase
VKSEERAERKRLGVYYTPLDLVRPLVEWAVSASTQRVLDPSYGDGRFLAEAAFRLETLGVSVPANRIFGAEIQPPTSHLLQNFDVPSAHLVSRDFFSCTLSTWGNRPFDAVVGNPPYVRHHLVAPENRTLAQQRVREAAVELDQRADVWAYFCSYLLGFLAPTGRMALVLPGSILHADYAAPVIDAWSRADRRVRMIRIQERQFSEVSERSVILLIDSQQSSAVEYQEVRDAAALADTLRDERRRGSRWRRGVSAQSDATINRSSRIRTRLKWFLKPAAERLWLELSRHPDVTELGEVATVRIGVVSGANEFFVINDSAAELLQGRSSRLSFVPCVSRNSWLRAPIWTPAMQRSRRGERSLLMRIPATGRLPKPTLEAIAAAEARGVHERSHCARRCPWYALEDSWVPDLFLPYMTSAAPHLVPNAAGATCTNAVHRVTVSDPAHCDSIAAGSWTSLFQLAAELVGRGYGGGVLKIEPSEARRLLLPLHRTPSEVHGEICVAYERGGAESATRTADRLVLAEHLDLDPSEITILHRAVETLRARRAR